MRWYRRLMYWLRFRSQSDGLREELSHHASLLIKENERRGLSPADARDSARRAMGNETFMREEARGVWLAPTIEAVLQDLRYAWRGLRRAPAFAVVAVVSLALGIGANAAIFSLVHALLLARLPIADAPTLIQLQRDMGAKGSDDRFSRAEFELLARGPLPLTMYAGSGGTMDLGGLAVNASIDAVDGKYFELLGLHAQQGRLIDVGDDAAASPLVVVTDAFWRRRLHADPAVIGRVVKLNQHPMTIVGIAPAGFRGLRFPAMADVFIPYRTGTTLRIIGGATPRVPLLTVVGRRGASQSVESTRDVLSPLWARCCARGALTATPRGVTPPPSALVVADVSRGVPFLKLNVRGEYRRILLALMAGVGILLVAACANVANLLLARSSARTSELAVRLALGASRSRLVMQLVIESVQLSVLGALAGLLLARWGTAILMRANVGNLVLIGAPTQGPMVLAFAIIVSLASGIVFGVISAVRVMNTDLVTPLKQAGRRAGRSQRGWMDRGLVAMQMALAILLVSGAALLVQTLRNLQRTTLGFDPRDRFAITVETRRTAYDTQGMTAQRTDEMLRRVRAIPGVLDAAFASLVPVYGGRGVSDLVTVRGTTPLAADAQTDFTGVSPGYFTALGIPLLAGRDIGPMTGVLGPTRDVVVNEQFAKTFFPDRNPIGQTFNDGDEGDTVSTQDRVVGVVGNTKTTELRSPAAPMFYVPIADGDWPYLVLVVRSAAGVAGASSAITRAIAAVAPGINQGDPTPIASSIETALARERMSAALATLFGAIALCLVAVGLYGVILYQVAERTTEIGIRMALGAGSRKVIALVLRQSLSVVAAGLIVGLPLSLLAGRAVASQLYGVTPYSMWALATAATSLVAIAAAATLIPARRAARIDPLTALRAD